MNTVANRSATAAPRRSSFLLTTLLACAPLAAQGLDVKPAPTPDPVKGWHDMTPMPASELAARAKPHRALPAEAARVADAVASTGSSLPPAVFFDRAGDGRLWACSPQYKASFGPDGFVYLPFLGALAPRNFPVTFVLRSVRIGGQALPLAAAEPALAGARVTFERGAVREVYDLRPDAVEQTFVVDSSLAGDVDVEIGVATELVEDAATAGIQFCNELGCVRYGDAHVVDGESLQPVPTTWDGQTIRIRVPAAARPAGPLVIDPIINAGAFTAILSGDAAQPDIAYDATSDTYLVVWEHPFSAGDIDVWSEFWYGDGTVVPGTLATIDFTSFSCAAPRVANLNAYDRFLVVMQRFDGTRWQIFGRLRLAGSAPHPITFAITDPGLSGTCINPDVGGDSAETGACDNFFVVWERQLSATDFDIHARIVRADTSLPGNTIFIDNTAATIHSLATVSQSNGNGFATAARWLVAYQFRFSATDEDIYGAAVAQNGSVTTGNTAIDTSSLSDFVPSVSSPNTTAAGGNPLFLVTYERQNPSEARARLLSGSLVNQIPAVNLTASFGLGGFWVRAECDGNRFAVISGAAGISVATLAYTGSALVLHEAPVALPTVPSYPRICSKRSGGGSLTDYGIAYVDLNWFPDRIITVTYGGHQPGNTVVRRVMGCNGLGIDAAGRSFLGESLTFSLSNAGLDIPGFAFGTPVPASNLVCGACPLGVDLGSIITVVGGSLTIAIPTSSVFVGYAAAVQGFALGSGPCVATLRFSDTIDFTVR